MNIALDLRLLNYKHTTGVSIYTLHLLYQFYLLKNSDSQISKKLKLTVIGLKPGNLIILQQKFPFLNDLFYQSIQLENYLGYKFIKNQKLINLLMLAKCRLKSDLNQLNITKFDYLFLPFSKPLFKHPDTKLITIFHDLYSILDRTNLSFTQKLLENNFNYNLLVVCSYQVWAVSLTTCKDLVKLFNPVKEKIKLVYSGTPEIEKIMKSDTPPLSNYKKNLAKNKQQEKYILAISGIEPRKNWYNLLLAHNFLQVTYPDYNLNLVLAGKPVNPSYYEKLLKLVTNLGITRITWKLDVSEFEKNELLQNCEFVVYPSLYEGFGFPILEAFKYQKPVITSKISSMPELAKNSALYINPVNFYDIARAIYILKTDTNLYLKLKDNCSKNLLYFNWQELRDKLKFIIQNN